MKIKVDALIIIIMASVAIKGSTRSFVIISPLAAPQRIPMHRTTGRIAASGICSNAIFAATTEANAMTDPTERSMPPINSTNVIPMAINADSTAYCRILEKFVTVKKLSEAAAPPIISKISMITGTACDNSTLFFIFSPYLTSAYCMIFSCVASSRLSSAVRHPAENTRIRSHIPSSSIISVEYIRTAVPCSAMRLI